MLSILNETKTKVFQQEQLTVRIFPSIQEMGSVAAKEVGDQICRLLESKPEINSRRRESLNPGKQRKIPVEARKRIYLIVF